ncbi:MAG: STAS domain-containing protein [Syntrophorhabdales bacterium]|jgi:anti-anti-sigma regulatory factor
MRDYRTETKTTLAVLHLRGDLALSCAGELRSALLESLLEATEIEIDLSSVTELGPACLQLLCTACKAAIGMNKRIRLVGPSGALEGAVRPPGQLCSGGYVLDKEDRRIWSGGHAHG